MATTTTEKNYDERKLLGLPTGHERPTGKVLVKLAKECGYKLRANASRKAALDAIADGSFAQRKLMQAAVRLEMGVPDDTPAKGNPTTSNGSGPTVQDMRDRIRSKGYLGDVPKGKDAVQAMHDSIVVAGVIPHSYPTGTRLQDEVDKPFTALAVKPAPRQKRVKVELSAKATAGRSVALAAIAEKANRQGQYVGLVGDAHENEADVWTATVELIPAS